jgi:hypothetical protein
MKWFFIPLLASLFSIFVLMALFVANDDEILRTYDNLGKAKEDGLVKEGLIPCSINPTASKISISFMPDSTRAYVSFRYKGNYPLDANRWIYSLNDDVQRIFCKAHRHFNRQVFEGSLSYFELQDNHGHTVYLAVDNDTHTAYLAQ